MRLNVLKNTKRNIVWGFGLKLLQLLMPIAVRAVFIDRLGAEYAGLGGLFTSILSFLNLAEMGAGSAVLYFMYKPVAENDTDSVRRLLKLAERFYRIVGIFIFFGGLLLVPFLNKLISGDTPEDINIYVIYILNLLSSAMSYWLFAYKRLILEAYQRNDIISRSTMIASGSRYILQLSVLLIFGNYYLYLVIEIFAQLFLRLIIITVVNKRYPEYRNLLEPSREMKKSLYKKTGALLFHKIGGVIVNSADAVVISAVMGLGILGKYQNYTMIMTAVLKTINILDNSVQAGIGNMIAIDGKDKGYSIFEKYSFANFFISTICSCCFLNLYRPFIQIWVGKEMLLDNGLTVTLCAYFFTMRMMMPGNQFESISGNWQYDRFRPLLEGLLNLGMNLVLVRFIGLYGILLSTIISMLFFSLPWLYINLMKNFFKRSFVPYLKKLLIYLISATMICAASYFVCKLIPTGLPLVAELAVKAVISTVVPFSILYLLCNRKSEWKWFVGLVKHI